MSAIFCIVLLRVGLGPNRGHTFIGEVTHLCVIYGHTDIVISAWKLYTAGPLQQPLSVTFTIYNITVGSPFNF